MSVARVSAGAVLLASSRTRAAMVAAIATSISSASADIQRQKRWRAAQVMVALAAAAHIMASALRGVLVDGRLAARNVSRLRLGVELATAGAIAGGSAVIARYAPSSDDPLRAEMAATALASAWRGLAYAEASKAARQGRAVDKAIERTRPIMAPRIERTAQTEIAQAYNEEHRAALREMHEDLVALVVRRWDSANDKRTCERCWRHDGEEVGLDESFSGGDEPGEMHPRCMCVEVIVIAEEKTKAA